MTRLLALAATAVLAAGSTACSGPASPQAVVVFAAASLTTVFTEIGERFAANHPDAAVELSTAGSSRLAEQLLHGAAADVFASADARTMDKVVQAGLVSGAPVDFASNTLVIAVPHGNPAGIRSFTDLARPGLDVVICARPVPCGAAAERIEDAAGVRLNPVSEESSVTDVLNKVNIGQADAGLVYSTDALAAGDAITAVSFPEAPAATNVYSIAALNGATNPTRARAFIDVVAGATGRAILSRAGFAAP